MQEFENIKFTNVELGGLAWFYDPPKSWANIKDCGDFPCTSPKNTLFSFKGTVWEGIKPANPLADFQVIPDNKGYSDQFPTCTLMKEWNAYMCNTEGLGILLWESEDPDKFDRSIQPVYYQYMEKEANQVKLNSFMDHVWDGFYSGQIRRSRFPGLIWGGKKDLVYNIKMTGTPAKKMKFKFITQSKVAGMTIKIHFPGAESRSIMKDGDEVPYNKWLKKMDGAEKDGYGPIMQTKCGENRFIGVENILEFYIDAGCEL